MSLAGQVSAELQGLTESKCQKWMVPASGWYSITSFAQGTDQPDADGNQARIFKIDGLKSTDGRDVKSS